jgi:hypothetical protein
MAFPFSSGYLLDRLYVEVHGGDRALLNDEHLAELNEEVYVEPTDVVFQTDIPLIMRVGTVHFVTYPTETVPFGSLHIPTRDVRTSTRLPGHVPVLIAKKDRVRQLTDFAFSREDSESTSF